MRIGRRTLLSASAGAVVESLMPRSVRSQGERPDPLRLFLGGDVMTGRGIDQILPHPSDPTLHEPYVKDARRYVELAARAHGEIEKPVGFSYIWGDAMGALGAADLRIVNLETTVSRSGKPFPKGINYRMNPRNLQCLREAGVDCCVLSNNHALDWGRAGLFETLRNLDRAGIASAGAGRNASEATRPVVLDSARESRGRVLVLGLGLTDSGIPKSWAATEDASGVHLLEGGATDVPRLARLLQRWRAPNHIVVASIHWGPNWGYRVSRTHRDLAHRMIDEAGVDVVHGHSSHHVKPIEIYHGKLILYGCGDLINDYEGIRGHEKYRGDLALGYLASVSSATGQLVQLEMVPLQMRRFRLNRATKRDARWLAETITAQGRPFGTEADLTAQRTLMLRW